MARCLPEDLYCLVEKCDEKWPMYQPCDLFGSQTAVNLWEV